MVERDGFFDVVLSQRATRRFSDEPVDDELVERCLEAATHAPSAENLQPWEFVVVRDPELRRAIGGLNRDAWRAGGRAHSEGRLPPALLQEVDEGAEGGIAAAPVLVVVCGSTERALAVTLPSSVFPAVQNLLLAAHALGLGSAMTTVVPLGRPAAPLGPPRREPVASKAHRDRFGRPW
jgi:nitroreductase